MYFDNRPKPKATYEGFLDWIVFAASFLWLESWVAIGERVRPPTVSRRLHRLVRLML